MDGYIYIKHALKPVLFFIEFLQLDTNTLSLPLIC